METNISKEELKKEQIHNAAYRCFSRFGFTKTTLDDIAAAIGMKKASLYYYYKNKEELFTEVIRKEVSLFFSEVQQVITEGKSAREKINLFINSQIEFMRQKLTLVDISIQVVIDMQPIFARLFNEFKEQDQALMVDIINEGIRNGEFRQVDAFQVADAIQALIDSRKFREFQNSGAQLTSEIDFDKLKKDIIQILDMLITGIKA